MRHRRNPTYVSRKSDFVDYGYNVRQMGRVWYLEVWVEDARPSGGVYEGRRSYRTEAEAKRALKAAKITSLKRAEGWIARSRHINPSIPMFTWDSKAGKLRRIGTHRYRTAKMPKAPRGRKRPMSARAWNVLFSR
jgi:hypothetical protein